MTQPNNLKELSDQIETQLRVKTYPLAIKLIQNKDEIPEDAVQPSKDLGFCLSTCQAFSYSRRRGLTMIELKEDMWCPEPVIGYGIEDPPEYFLQGNNRYPDDVKTLEAGKTWATQEFPRMETGKYIGVLSAPLRKAGFKPDVIMIYCTPAQLTLILLALAHEDGLDLESKIGGHSACVYGVVHPLKKKQCWISTPCGGDRWRAMAGDDEMIFSLPLNEAERLLEGLRFMEKTGRKIPFGLSMQPQYPLDGSYREIGKLLGMNQIP